MICASNLGSHIYAIQFAGYNKLSLAQGRAPTSLFSDHANDLTLAFDNIQTAMFIINLKKQVFEQGKLKLSFLYQIHRANTP